MQQIHTPLYKDRLSGVLYPLTDNECSGTHRSSPFRNTGFAAATNGTVTDHIRLKFSAEPRALGHQNFCRADGKLLMPDLLQVMLGPCTGISRQ